MLLNVGYLLIGNEDIGVVEYCFHLVGISYHICGGIAPVKLHTFHDIQLCLHGLGLFNGDYAVVADLFHSLG